MTLKEQLILRQVCHTTKQWIEESSLPRHVPVTTIQDHGAKSFTKFLEKRPPHLITDLRIENNSENFLNDPLLARFMHLHSSNIKRLHMKIFFTCKTRKELEFYEGFPNLSEFLVDKISISSLESQIASSFPRNFKNLKTLKLGSVKAFPEPPDDLFGAALIPLDRQRPMGFYVWNLIGFCEKLEFLGYPKTSKYFFQAFIDGRGRCEFGAFCDYVRKRHQLFPNQPNLKICDFQNDNWSPDTKNALPLLKLGQEFGIKFLNVNANLFQFVSIDKLIRMYDLQPNTSDCILSFKNFNCLITGYLPSIERISMTASEANAMLDYSCVYRGPKSFPNLREIEIVIDVGITQARADTQDNYYFAREFRDVRNLLSHFFYDMEMILLDHQDAETHVRVYENIESLIIKLTNLPCHTARRKATPEDLPLQWITQGLPNLRKLTLVGWDVKNRDTCHQLWKGFRLLEEMTFEDCENLGDTCFMESSKDQTHPHLQREWKMFF